MKGAFASVRMDENHPHWQYASARAGKLYSRSGDFRTEFGRDYTRIIHSLAYSRLKLKCFLRRRTIIYRRVSTMSIRSIP